MTRTEIQDKLVTTINTICNGLPEASDKAARVRRIFRALVHIGTRLMLAAGAPIEMILALAAEAIADESGEKFVFAVGRPLEGQPFGASPKPTFKC